MPVPIVTVFSVASVGPLLLMLTVTFAGPVCSPEDSSPVTTTMLFSSRLLPRDAEAVSGLTSSVSAVLPAAQADSEAMAMAAMAARPPRRRLRLTAAASPLSRFGWSDLRLPTAVSGPTRGGPVSRTSVPGVAGTERGSSRG